MKWEQSHLVLLCIFLSFLCGPLRISAFSALMGLSTQRTAEIRRGPQRKQIRFVPFCGY